MKDNRKVLNILWENIRNHTSERYVRMTQSCMILAISALVIVSSVITVFERVIYAPEQLLYNGTNQKMGYIDNGLQGIFSFGPYINLNKGRYEITIYYETDTDTMFDICYKDEGGTLLEIVEGALECGESSKTIVIYNERDILNETFEVRTYYQGTGYLQVNAISVRQCFGIDGYMVTTLLTIIISLLFICGKSLSGILERPRVILCFACFYTVAAYLCFYLMKFPAKQKMVWMYGILNVAIVLHAYGNKKGLYDNEVVAGKILSAVCYVFLFCSLYWLDRVMQSIVSKGNTIVYADNTPYIFTYSIITCIVFITALIRNLRAKRIFYGIVYYIFVVLLAVQDIYYQVFHKLFSFRDMQLAGEGSDYVGYVFGFMNGSFWTLFFLLNMIGAVGIFLLRYTAAISREWKIVVCSVIAVGIVHNCTAYTRDYGEWNSFDNENFIYDTMNDRVRAFKLCGFYQYELKDLKKIVMRELVRDEKNTAEIATFFADREEEEPHETNAMTGILEGKNVIFVLMESIDDIACREDVMPILYKMSKEGINFSNMYAPIYGTAATINSETVTNIGYYAPLDGSLIYSFADNSFPYSLASRFTDAGYTARQYHFNDPEFYDRGIMNSTFGYKEYVSFIENTDGTVNIRLDTALVEDDKLYQTLVQEEKFFDYIISYTAHLPYDAGDDLVQAALERYPEYANLTYSEEMNYYFAKARITDDMLGGLIHRLDQDGLLENTVIIAIGDHYPYGLADKDALYDLSGVDKYEQLLYRVPCVVWTPGIEAVEVDKTAGSIDLVPTIVNLMGLGDCSVYIGHDIFDESYEGYAYFSDGAWITGNSYYYQGKIVYGTMDENKVADINRKVMETITANDNILHTDYWRNPK